LLILRVDYSFQFLSRPEMADNRGLSKDQAQKIGASCKAASIGSFPLINLLGHQSWQSSCGKLLKVYPEFDETPAVEVSREIRLAQSGQTLLQELLPASPQRSMRWCSRWWTRCATPSERMRFMPDG